MSNFTFLFIQSRSPRKKKALSVSRAMAAALISISALGAIVTTRAIAQEQPDCFMRDKSGNLMNLTRSVCGLLPEEFAPLPDGAEAAAGAYLIPIKGRRSNLPIVDVTFNGAKTYEMILDTGASGTLITQEMAEGLNVITAQTGITQVADGREVEIGFGLVGSISAGGLTVSQIQVGIAPSGLPIGLLGQDFFGAYDMTIKENVVELRARGS